MDQARFEYLYEKYLKRNLNGDEHQEWKAALADPNLYAELNNLVKELWNRNDLPAPELDKARAEAIYTEIVTSVKGEESGAAELKIDVAETALPVRKLRFGIWSRVAAAAAVAAIVFGVWFFSAPRHSGEGRNPGSAKYTNDIVPGRNTALLTLANGEVITLDTSKNSVVIADSVKTFTMLTASTPRGGTYRITLPDGTKVWLNAASTLKFPSQFTGAERIVELTGEAYFEVATSYSEVTTPSSSLRGRRTKQSFLVRSAGQELSVLGTHFNVNAYDDETAVRTTLLEGSVRINNEVTLLPGQQSLLSKDSNIKVQKVDSDEATAWKNGYFQFDAENLETVMRKISRWYDVDVVFENAQVRQVKFSGTMSRYENVGQILKKIEAVSAVQYTIKGKTIILR